MIRVRVRWFAAYRELAGTESESIETHATTPAELFEEMKGRHESLGGRSSALVAIDDQMSDWSAQLRDGNEVLFFPPVSGG
ncbi:MAG TPA: MoaD/ThiS family protein [Xanthomonadales bacterium]|nr:MoaD/ThiS family protein [Xanthomonadales bacterium]